jgi:hypothetical protein
MKKKQVLLFAIITASVLFTTVIAKQPTDWEQYAYGTITEYDEAYSSEIVTGFWKLKVQDKKVWFEVNYMEKNLIEAEEGSPEDSVDTFEMTITGAKPFAMWTDEGEGQLYIFAKLQVKKTWATPDGTYESKTWYAGRFIIFDFDDPDPWMLMDGWPPDPRSNPEPGDPVENPIDFPVIPGEPWTYDWDINGEIIDSDY